MKFAAAAVLAFVAGACGGGGGGELVTASLEIGGDVLAPSGRLAQVSPDLAPVAGALVELIEVDLNGDQVGEVLATSLTSTTGHYNLVLPAGLSLSAMLMVRVTGATGPPLRSLVVSETVDITPKSEYIARKLTSDGNTLDKVSNNEVLLLSGHLEQFDFFVAPSIEETIANLDLEAGPSLAPLLDLAQQPAGDASTIAGDYFFVNFGLPIGTFPQTRAYTDQGDLTVVDDGNGAGSLTDINATESEAVLNSQDNGAGGVIYSLFTEFDVELNGTGAPFQLSADGSFTILEPFEEEIFAQGQPGFPGGLRAPASATTLHPLANGFFAGVAYYEETVYDMTDDGTAIDLTKPRGDVFSYDLTFAIKKGPIANSAIDGNTYGVVSFGTFFTPDGSRELFGDVGTMEFTSTGTTTGTIDGLFDVFSLNRSPFADSRTANVGWANTGAGGIDDPITAADNEVIPYTLNPNTGALTMQAGTPEPEQACLASGGEFFALALDLDEGDPIDGACRGTLMGIRLGTVTPTVASKTYKLLVIEKGVNTNGSSYISRLLGASLTITGEGTLSLTGTGAEISRGNDLGDGVESGTDNVSETGTYSFTGSNGRVSIVIDGTKLEGWMNADGSVGALSLHNSNIDVGGDASLGLVILVEQK